MPEGREGAIPPELYSTLVLVTGSITLASKTLPGTIEAFFSIPPSQRSNTLNTMVNSVRPIFENRSIIDTQFKAKFGKRFFQATTDDGIATLDISTPCDSQKEFAYKIQALAELITRARDDVKELIIDSNTRQTVTGSINILEAILRERFENYDPEIISNLRKIKTLRNKIYPSHAFEPEAIKIIEEMGFAYPPNDWNEVWQTVLELCSESFEKLMNLFRTGTLR